MPFEYTANTTNLFVRTGPSIIVLISSNGSITYKSPADPKHSARGCNNVSYIYGTVIVDAVVVVVDDVVKFDEG